VRESGIAFELLALGRGRGRSDPRFEDLDQLLVGSTLSLGGHGVSIAGGVDRQREPE
jgi:hypothetical protein